MRGRWSAYIAVVVGLGALLPAVPGMADARPWESLYTGDEASGDSLIGLWQFLPGAELKDASGNGHDLSLRGQSRVLPDGRVGGCLESFPGGAANDKPQGAMALNKPALTPPGAFTVELWIKPKPEFSESSTVFLVDKKYFNYARDTAEANTGYCLYLARTKDDAVVMRASLGFGTDSIFPASAPVQIPLEQWSHVAFTYDGAGTCRFFLDGEAVGISRHEGRGPVAHGTHALIIGDRVGSTYNGFPGYISQVRLSHGLVPFFTGTIVVSAGGGRTAFRRMEPDAKVQVRILNDTGKALEDVKGTLRLAGAADVEVTLGSLAMGETRVVPVPVDTRLKPGSYALSVQVSGRHAAGTVSGGSDVDVVIAPRPRPHVMPVVMWGNGDIETLKDIGFTHDLKHLTDYAKIWEAGEVTTSMEQDPAEGMARTLNRYLAEGLGATLYIYPGRWVERNESLSQYLRVDRNGEIYPRHNISPNFPEIMRYGYTCGASVAATFGDYPALSSALVHSEIRDGTNISHHEVDQRLCREALGFDIPREAASKGGVHYSQIPGFPEDRVIPDDHRLLRFYSWFWERGDGWNPLHTEVHRGLHSTGRDDLWTFFDPAVRVPSKWGSGGKVDVISQWTYSYPDPLKIGQATDELFAMAEGTPGQDVMKMTQVIWYRKGTAPELPKDESDWVDWEREIPDAKFVTISPDHMREAFWSKLSRPIKGIMYHGWGSLVKASHGSYRFTNPHTREVLSELVHEVVQPLGPTLLQVPDRPADVAVLESFSSQIFASRGSHGWSNSWEADMHLILQWAGLQPRIIYDETILRDGLDAFRVLVMPYCDVLQQSVADAIRAFQERGGVVVADEHLAPAISPDILIPTYKRRQVAVEDKAVLQEKARELWSELQPFYSPYVMTSSQDVVPRCRRFETTDYVFLVNDQRTYGDYVGHHRLVMEKGLPSAADVAIRRPQGTVYDLVAHAEVPSERRDGMLHFRTHLGPGEGKVYMVTDQPIHSLRCQVPGRVRRGGTLDLSARVSGSWGRTLHAVVPLDVQILDPQGQAAEISGFYGADGGSLRLSLDLAVNDTPGTWRVRVRELASGKSVEHSVTVE